MNGCRHWCKASTYRIGCCRKDALHTAVGNGMLAEGGGVAGVPASRLEAWSTVACLGRRSSY
eukprot:1158421-Pelagomonas_calceolata.AAC.1